MEDGRTPGHHPPAFVAADQPAGARLLADLHGESPWPYVRRAEDARDHCWHVVHDLEANGFFIDLALASRLALREGVLLWIGEESCCADRRLFAKANRRPVATPDGAGSYLFAGNVIHFDLGWDRGTASLSRLEKKVRTAISYFKDSRNAERMHILYVLSRPAREEALRPIIQDALDEDSCRFWTTTVERLEVEGPLGRLWCDAKGDASRARLASATPSQGRDAPSPSAYRAAPIRQVNADHQRLHR